MSQLSTSAHATPPVTIAHEIAALGHWFHNLHLPDGTQTAPHHALGDFPACKWQQLREHIPQDLSGWTVLDVGCNAGFYSFELAKRGGQVTGIDHDPHYLAQARWAARQYGVEARVTFRQMQVYDLAQTEERFDLVLLMGAFDHLRYPTLALDIVAQRTTRLLVLPSLTMPGKAVCAETAGLASEPHFAGDPTNGWAPTQTCIEALLHASRMQVAKTIGHQIYLCTPAPASPSTHSG